ncbi:hypothetical protein CDEST_11200 [Colletotrichum destructivum]|uniref:Uncharacterized protein n=1 Tax=Colletotrichum destructivum TaxID=34406 RepID=A0AAX4ISJ9_9PEZI|nr:hypothetical protein CDEST_11200 [Colletotrichum destructivum]
MKPDSGIDYLSRQHANIGKSSAFVSPCTMAQRQATLASLLTPAAIHFCFRADQQEALRLFSLSSVLVRRVAKFALFCAPLPPPSPPLVSLSSVVTHSAHGHLHIH